MIVMRAIRWPICSEITNAFASPMLATSALTKELITQAEMPEADAPITKGPMIDDVRPVSEKKP